MAKYKRYELTTKIKFKLCTTKDKKAVLEILRMGLNKMNRDLAEIDPTAVVDYDQKKIKVKKLLF